MGFALIDAPPNEDIAIEALPITWSKEKLKSPLYWEEQRKVYGKVTDKVPRIQKLDKKVSFVGDKKLPKVKVAFFDVTYTITVYIGSIFGFGPTL